MISTSTRLRIKDILKRIERNEFVTLDERIFINKLSGIYPVLAKYIASSLEPKDSALDND